MPTVRNELNELLQLVPEWERYMPGISASGGTAYGVNPKDVAGTVANAEILFSLFEQVGPRSIYKGVLSLGEKRQELLKLVRDHYLIKLAGKILSKNPTLRRFFQERRIDRESQSGHIASLSAELAFKLDEALKKKINEKQDDGFKVLLPAYVQSSANNAVIDFIKIEFHWEKQTLQDLNLDSEEEDPRLMPADDLSRIPENIALSGEKVKYLNQFRGQLEKLFKRTTETEPSLLVVDCMFGMGLSPHSTVGTELTMRECCERLSIAGETQARKIARCQVLLDKGLDQIREVIRQKLPDMAEYRQHEINVNTASRRDLNHQLGLTEGEIERLVTNRQFANLSELVEKSVIRPERLSDLASKSAVAAYVPVDLNSATVRDLIDILGVSKEAAKKLSEARPFRNLKEIVEKRVLAQKDLSFIEKNGAVLRVLSSPEKQNINKEIPS